MSAPRLVILRALGLGDLLTALPALRALARAFPHHERLLAAPAPLAALLPTQLARLVAVGPLEPLPAALAGADVAVNLHGRGPQSHRLLSATRPERLLWWANADVPESADAPQWRAGEHEVTRWCRMLAEYGIPADPGELCLSAPPGEAPACAHGATVIHPGAASAARRWPAERFGAVARAERAAGRDVVITGGTPETALANEVARLGEVPKGRVLAGRTDLAGLARTIAVAGRVVCGDTGVAHLATALHTPSVVLFGPVSPAVWGPPPEPRHRVLWSGSHGDPHADSVDHGLLEIGVSDVLAQLRRLEPARRRALLAQGAPKSCT